MSLFIKIRVGITAICYLIKVKAFIQTNVNHLLEINANSCINFDANTLDFSLIINSLYFSRLNLSEISLNIAILISIDFKSANFSGANLNRADFTRANLSSADFERTNIADTNFVKDYFAGANLSESETTNINLRGGTEKLILEVL